MASQSEEFYADTNDSGWALDQSDGTRTFDKRINFSPSFQKAPKVIVGLSGLDADQSKNIRVRLEAHAVDPNGFTARILTWGDTSLFGVGVNWLAHDSL